MIKNLNNGTMPRMTTVMTTGARHQRWWRDHDIDIQLQSINNFYRGRSSCCHR